MTVLANKESPILDPSAPEEAPLAALDEEIVGQILDFAGRADTVLTAGHYMGGRFLDEGDTAVVQERRSRLEANVREIIDSDTATQDMKLPEFPNQRQWDSASLRTFVIACKAFRRAKKLKGRENFKIFYLWDPRITPQDELKEIRTAKKTKRDEAGYPLALPAFYREIAQRYEVPPNTFGVKAETALISKANRVLRRRPGEELPAEPSLKVLDRDVFVEEKRDEEGEVLRRIYYVLDDDGQRIDLTKNIKSEPPTCKTIAGVWTKDLASRFDRVVNLWARAELNCQNQEHVRLQRKDTRKRIAEIYIGTHRNRIDEPTREEFREDVPCFDADFY